MDSALLQFEEREGVYTSKLYMIKVENITFGPKEWEEMLITNCYFLLNS